MQTAEESTSSTSPTTPLGREDAYNVLGEDWLTALARLEEAGVKYQRATKAKIADRQRSTRDAEHKTLHRIQTEALYQLGKAAMLLPLGDDDGQD